MYLECLENFSTDLMRALLNKPERGTNHVLEFIYRCQAVVEHDIVELGTRGIPSTLLMKLSSNRIPWNAKVCHVV